jgi:NitT/TauT family transport system substrate-binding protein
MKRRTFLSSATACALSPFASTAIAQVAPTQLVISPSTGEDAAALYYAMQQGWFQQAGLELSVLPANGAAAMPAVIGGAVQIAYANVYSLVIAYKKGIPITLVAPGVSYVSATAFWQLLVAGDSPIHTPKDLQGKIIAVSELGDMASTSSN